MMYRVTRKMLINGKWIDGPVELMDEYDLERFKESHTHYKVEALPSNFSSDISSGLYASSFLGGFEWYIKENEEPEWWRHIDEPAR